MSIVVLKRVSFSFLSYLSIWLSVDEVLDSQLGDLATSVSSLYLSRCLLNYLRSWASGLLRWKSAIA